MLENWKRMASVTSLATGIAVLASAALQYNEAAAAQDSQLKSGAVEIGTLTCNVLPKARRNYSVRSTAEVNCEFSILDQTVEIYKGVTGVDLGIDLDLKAGGILEFTVLSSRKKGKPFVPNGLAGKYFGVPANGSTSQGIGAAVLVGGSDDSYSLKPIGIETLRKLGLNAGRGYLYLEPRVT